MKLTKHSVSRMRSSLREYSVPAEYANTIENYLVYGFTPGSFFTALLANDAMTAICSSHLGNSIQDLKTLICWIQNRMPREAYGSYEIVYNWYKHSVAERRAILEEARLIYPEAEEIVKILKGDPVAQFTGF